MRRASISLRQLIALFILFSLSASLGFGQRQPAQPKAPACTGAWTGNITYSRSYDLNDHKVIDRVSARGKDTRDIAMKARYKASVAVVEDRDSRGSSIGKASIESSVTTSDKTLAEERNSCDRGKTFKVMSGNFETKTEARGQASSQQATVGVGVNSDGTYKVSVSLPSIQGISSGSYRASFGGQCSPKEGANVDYPQSTINVDGKSMESSGNDRVDPNDANALSGSYTTSALGVTQTITWSLKRCGGELRISDLQFEDMKFPNWNDWEAINEQKGTIDGNFVRIKAKILNTSPETKQADLRFKETYKGDKWDGARPDAPLKDEVFGVRVEPNDEATVEFVLDSSGYAWFDDGRPRLLQRIKVELEQNGKKIDERTENLKIAPKPLVLVHGLWSNWHAWETWQNILTTTHSYDWKAFPVGEKPEHGVMNTGKEFMSTEPTASIADNASQLASYVKYAQEDRNAWHVDIVAHSMGGLISRYYINQIMPNYPDYPRPRVSHLIMLGTPNMGSPCADLMDLAFGMTGDHVEAIRQLRTDVVDGFNKVHTQRKGVKFSALAGNPLPAMCKEIVPNDGVVSVPSAKWIIKDVAESGSIHTDLTGTSDFSSFVKPRLAIGPKGNHNPELPDILNQRAGQNYRQDRSLMFVNAGYQQQSEIPNPKSQIDDRPDFAKLVRLVGKQSLEIEIPVEQAQNFGVTLMADSNISATLVNEKGEIMGKNLAKTPEASVWFRSIYYDKPTTKATWKLKLENTSEREFQAIIASWRNAAAATR